MCFDTWVNRRWSRFWLEFEVGSGTGGGEEEEEEEEEEKEEGGGGRETREGGGGGAFRTTLAF